MYSAAERRTPAARTGWIITVAVLALTLLVVALAVHRAVVNPRTDDAEVFANFIGMAPIVDGPIVRLAVHDNQLVHKGDLLFEIDDRPYRYALQRALSEQASLEGEIEDRSRGIAAQTNAVSVAAANIASAAASHNAANAAVSQAEADVERAKAGIQAAEASRQYAENNLHRLEPLLAKQFVTVDQVDAARTLLETRTREEEQAKAQLALAQARLESQRALYVQAGATVTQSKAQHQQAASAVETLAPLTREREARAAAVRDAEYNLENCKVYAPFDARVTNLTISEGAFAHAGMQVFTLIDNRTWWVVANFRETQLDHIAPGSAADVFLMERENIPLHGVVESIGFGVTPDPSVTGPLTTAGGLPPVQRTLSWVHLAARYPVRVRIENPPPDLLRIGQTAVAVVHPLETGAQEHGAQEHGSLEHGSLEHR